MNKQIKRYLTLFLVFVMLLTVLPTSIFAAKVTITFDPDGGTLTQTTAETNEEGKIADLGPFTPTKEGYDFKGWYKEESHSTEVTTDTTFTDNAKVYAKWEKKEYTIIFEANGGEAVTEKVTVDQKLAELPTTTKAGYTFVGWYTNTNDEGTKVSTETTFAKDTTVYAKWDKKEYTITFDPAGGKLSFDIKTKKTDNGKLVDIENYKEPTRDGYVFRGWFLEGGTEEVTKNTIFTQDTTIYAKWEKVASKEYKVTFKSNGGTSYDPVMTKGKKLSKLPIPERKGYIFRGWYLEPTFKNLVDIHKIYHADTNLYAKWQKVSCKVDIHDVTVYSDRVSGKATPGARITLYRSNGSRIDSATTNSKGYFTIYTSYFYNYGYRYEKWYNDRYYYGYRTGYLIGRIDGCEDSDKYYLNDRYYWHGDYVWDRETVRIYPTNIRRTNYSVSGDTTYKNTRISVYDGNTYLGSTWTDRDGEFYLTWNRPSVPTGRNLQYYVGDKVRAGYATTPVIKEADPDTKVVKGTAGKYASITVQDSKGNVLGKSTADKDGLFTVYLNRTLIAGETIKVIANENTRNDSSVNFVVKKAEPVANLTRKAYIVGYPDGTFRPQATVTRAEAAQMFASLLNGSTNFGTSKQTKFTDANNDWYSPAVNYVVGKGLISGYQDGTFKPNANITRAEFAQMISGYLQKGYPGHGALSDVKGHWAADAIDKVYGNKAVKGYPDGTFKPNRELTRAEAVTVLNAVFNRKTTSMSLNNVNAAGLKTFTDVHVGFWAYYEILDAANSHMAYKLSNGDQTDIWK